MLHLFTKVFSKLCVTSQAYFQMSYHSMVMLTFKYDFSNLMCKNVYRHLHKIFNFMENQEFV